MTDLATAHNLIRWVDRRAVLRSRRGKVWIWILPPGLERDILELISTPRYAPLSIEEGAQGEGEYRRAHFLLDYEPPSDPPEDASQVVRDATRQYLEYPYVQPLRLLEYLDTHPAFTGPNRVWALEARPAWVPMSFRFKEALEHTGLDIPSGKLSRVISSSWIPGMGGMHGYYNLNASALGALSLREQQWPTRFVSDVATHYVFPGHGTITMSKLEQGYPGPGRTSGSFMSYFTFSAHPESVSAQAVSPAGSRATAQDELSATSTRPVQTLIDAFTALL